MLETIDGHVRDKLGCIRSTHEHMVRDLYRYHGNVWPENVSQNVTVTSSNTVADAGKCSWKVKYNNCFNSSGVVF